MKHIVSLLTAALCALTTAWPVAAVETDCLVRDPSTIVKKDGTYWLFGTGKGTQQFSSTDRIHWTNQGPALSTAPGWLAAAVPGNDNEVWAPDIHFFNGKYYLYSSYSKWGSNNSAIGVATNATLDPKAWVDQGRVIRSVQGGNLNAIDPCIFTDADGNAWLSYGSYVSGIKLVQINP
ncbi:MAG: arabinan endo-1,5-alpha-L-arabinosidase, partial [Armatimonadota bacterium]|nr:arabinan endo-1,5-alpha-L-arabinosidase [Armatimonadota bacterium]